MNASLGGSIEAWEGEGGAIPAAPSTLTVPLRGSEAQVEWAERIRLQVDAEFDRVASAFRVVSRRQTLWEQYLLLTRIEQAFKDLKGELAIRPVHHQRDERIEAHIFVSFQAYCLHATLRNLARRHAGGLSPRAILEKLSAMQMIDVHLPATDGKHIVLSRYTEPEADVGLLLAQLQIPLPAQSPPKVYASGKVAV